MIDWMTRRVPAQTRSVKPAQGSVSVLADSFEKEQVSSARD